MKKIVFVPLLVSFLGTAIGFKTMQTEATQTGAANTSILFDTNTDPTNPVDPENPDNPDPPVDPIDPENPGTGNDGPLSIDFVSNITFGEKVISPTTTTYQALNEHPYVQVTDKTGSGNGWTLTAAASPFVSKKGGSTLKGAELSFLNGKVNTSSSNVSAAPTTESTVIFTNTDSKNITTAGTDAGKGTWVTVWSGSKNANENILLKVLAGSATASDYAATITWTLTSGPSNP